ncbi:MAG: membrane dipeptidase [Pseudomonadota bacterium]
MSNLILTDDDLIKAFIPPEGAEKALLVDGHVDLTYFMMSLPGNPHLSTLEEGPFTLEKMKASGCRLFAGALYCQDTFNGERSLSHLKKILDFTLTRFDEISILKNRRDLEKIKGAPDSAGTLLLLENADALAGNLLFMDALRAAGVWIVGLTHMGQNRLGDGNAVPFSEGLTGEGRAVIRALKKNGFLIDTAHLHPKCFWQLMDLVESPLITSHTGIREACNTPRNIDLEQAGEIVARKGLIGLTFNPEMLSPEGNAGVEDIFVHLDLVVQKFGPECAGLGSDFCGFEKAARGMEDITEVPNLVRIMLDHGYGEDAVGKIMGLNWLRLFEDLLSS